MEEVKEPTPRSDIVRGLLIWLVWSVLGTFVVSLPDRGQPVFRLSETHGPTITDTIGVLMLLVGWSAILLPLIRHRSLIELPKTSAAIALVGAAVVVWSIATDSGLWWIVGAVVLVGVQLIAAFSIARAPAAAAA